MFRRILDRIRHELWQRDLVDAGPARRLTVWSARVLYHVTEDIRGGQLTLRAMSLVYTTLLSLIPLLAISFSVLKGFGVHRELEPFLITYLAPLGERADELAEHLIRFIDNTNVTVLGYLGFALLFYAIVSLLQKVEQAFNHVWRVTVSRSFPERIRDYLVLVIIGPTLMFLATGIWATILGTDFITKLAAIQPFGWILGGVTRLLPFLLVITAFTFVYVFVPNVRVRWLPALAGAVVAGLLWNIGGIGFAYFVGHSANYPAIYSSFATAVFFMIWLYLAWMILFIGGSISFYAQNAPLTAQEEAPAELSHRFREKLALAAMQQIAARFFSDETPHTLATLSAGLAVPSQAIESVLGALEDCEIILRTGGAEAGYVPAHDPGSITATDVLGCIRRAGEVPGLSADDVADPGVDAAWREIERAWRADRPTLRELARGGPTD